MASFRYVVLGGGNAAGYAAREFVKRNVKNAELCIISSEKVAPYERPALSKAYLAPTSPARLPGFHTCVGVGGDKQTPEWYQEHGITCMLGATVTKADLAGKTLSVSTAEGELAVRFEYLLIATGCDVTRLTDFGVKGADAKGIHYLRDVADADALVAAMAECKERGGEALIVGGGYIGMECAAAVANNGIKTTMVFPEDRMMSRLFSRDMADFYEGVYATKGIKFVKGQVVDSFNVGGDGHVAGAKLKSGTELPCRLVVVGAGARPRTSLFEGQLEIADRPIGGIKVDGNMRTSVPGVYAVGDVAAFPLLREGGRLVRQEHVTHARLSAAHAVSHIMDPGNTPAYDYLPFFYSREFHLSWQFYGRQVGEPLVFGDKASGKWGAY